MKVIAWRITKKGKMCALDQKFWDSVFMWSGFKLGAAVVTSPVTIWATKALILYVIWRTLWLIFDAFEIRILGSLASLVLLVVAFEEIILTPIRKLDAVVQKVEGYSRVWDYFVEPDIDNIHEKRAEQFEKFKSMLKDDRPTMPNPLYDRMKIYIKTNP